MSTMNYMASIWYNTFIFYCIKLKPRKYQVNFKGISLLLKEKIQTVVVLESVYFT